MSGQRKPHAGDVFPRLRVSGADRLAVVFGDQLDIRAAALQQLDKERDAVLMMEVLEESTVVPSHKQRTAFFLSAMRHFAQDLVKRGYRVHYICLDDRGNTGTFAGELARAIRQLGPRRLVCTEPGEWRVLHLVEHEAQAAGIEVDIRVDEHFLTTRAAFSEWIAGRKQAIMEYFYREQRRRLDILVDAQGRPVGGAWNYDKDNRGRFKSAPDIPPPYLPRADAVTTEVLALVQQCLPDNPGHLDSFRWPVTPAQAARAIAHFIEHRLPSFGDYQDAMWTAEPLVYHSMLSAALNVKLLDPRDCVAAALQAYEAGLAPLNCVEGFIRQIIGWREFIRGIYWHEGPDYGQRNELQHHGTLPDLYWTAKTEMACVQECVEQVLDSGYGHHIQRLMVTGNFALIAGVDPQAVSNWYLGMYGDAVAWVTLPNTLGMALHADGGVVGTKPYASTGKYIQRMSNYCKGCRFDPALRAGPQACPFTTFYWDFLIRHHDRFRRNNRMAMILKTVERMDPAEKRRIGTHAQELRHEFGISPAN